MTKGLTEGQIVDLVLKELKLMPFLPEEIDFREFLVQHLPVVLDISLGDPLAFQTRLYFLLKSNPDTLRDTVWASAILYRKRHQGKQSLLVIK